MLREWQESVATRTPHYSEARVWNARAGAYRHTVSRGTPVFRSDGSVREWVGSDSDVHEQKQLSESLQEASRRKDEFLATLAHELRNPLAPLRNGLQIIKLVPHDMTKVERAVAIMDRQLNQMVRLIDDLLDVSRIQPRQGGAAPGAPAPRGHRAASPGDLQSARRTSRARR